MITAECLHALIICSDPEGGGGKARDLSSVSKILFSLIQGALICEARRSSKPPSSLSPPSPPVAENTTGSNTVFFFNVVE